MVDQTSPIVDIVDVVPNAIVVYADQVRKADQVFDVWGYTHPIVNDPVIERRKVILVRHDGYVDHFDPGSELTIVPGDGDVTRGLDKESSGSRQGYIETGRYSTVAEEREINPDSHTDEEA